MNSRKFAYGMGLGEREGALRRRVVADYRTRVAAVPIAADIGLCWGKENGMAYWVIGGEYTDTRFETPAPGKALERHGPFGSYEEALQVWAARAWATVDDAHARFRIVREEG